MNARTIALLAAALPFLGVHLSYLVAAGHGLVEWCNPYWDSCTSISATGRYPPASYLFRGLMLPAAAVLAAYWWLNSTWLRAARRDAGLAAGAAPGSMLALGVIASVALVLYVSVLGADGRLWRFQRHVGTVVFFTFSYLAQLLLADQLRKLYPRPAALGRLAAVMLGICILLLAIGIGSVLLDFYDQDFYDGLEDAFEWVMSLLLQVNVLLGYLAWRAGGWQLRLERVCG